MRVFLLLLTGMVCGSHLDATALEDGTPELSANTGKAVQPGAPLKRTTVLGQAANLTKDGNGWKGVLRGDGEAIIVDGRTQVLFRDAATGQIEPGSLVAYEGRREPDGLVAAEKLEVSTNPVSKAEERLWRTLTPRIQAGKRIGGLLGRAAGNVEFAGLGSFKIATDAEAQSYLQRIGEAVAPAYLRDLPAGSRRKLDFQFYLVQSEEFGAFSLASGTVVVNAEVFQVLRNEAQLAAVLAHEIAHVTQQHQYLFGQAGEAAALTAVRNGYPAELEEQADRIALGYLAAAGYDPREAAGVWTEIEKLHGIQQSRFFWGNVENAGPRESYLAEELHNNYSTLNLISYSLGGNDFARIGARLGDRDHNSRGVESGSAEVASAQTAGNPGQAIDDSGERQSPFNTVTINSNPVGSPVYIGGQLAGKTPLTVVTGKIGQPFVVSIQRPGYLIWTVQSVSVPGNTKLFAELAPAH